jgi:antitoxin component YwqK of YwqJK toxin-antitoxin module
MAKVTIYFLTTIKPVLDKVIEMEFPASTTFKLLKITNQVQEQIDLYQNTLTKITNKYENGRKAIQQPTQYQEEYNGILEEMRPVLNTEVEIDNGGLTVDDISHVSNDKNITLTVRELASIQPLLNNKKEGDSE